MKRTKRLAAAMLAALLMLICAAAAADSDADVLSFDVRAVVTREGALNVTETLKYRVTDDINGFTRDIDPSFGTGVEGFSAAIARPEGELELVHDPDARRGDSGVYSFEQRNGGMLRYYIYSPGRDGDEVTVVYRYSLPGVCSRYGDVGMLALPLLGDGWELDIERFYAELSFEGGAPADIDVRVEETGMKLEQCAAEGGAVVVRGTDAGDGEPLRLRILFPQDMLDAMAYTDQTPMRAAILNAEAERDALTHYYNMRGVMLLVLCGVLAALLIVIACLVWGNDGYTERRDYVPGMPLPVPEGVTPAELKYALSKGPIYTSNDLAATLLDLTRRGWLTIQGEGKNMTYTATGKPLDGCAEHERFVLEWVLGLGNGASVDMQTIERAAHKTDYVRSFEKWQRMVTDSAKARGWYLKRTTVQKVSGIAALAAAAAALVAGICCIAMSSMTEVLGGCLLGGMLALTAGGTTALAVNRRAPECAQLAADWKAVRRWLKSEWRAEELGMDAAQWEQLMVYAMVLGNSAGLAKRLEAMEPGYAQVMMDSAGAVLLRQGGYDTADVVFGIAFYGNYCRSAGRSMTSHSGSSSSGGGGSVGGGGGGGTF